jgi:hypothetical protein
MNSTNAAGKEKDVGLDMSTSLMTQQQPSYEWWREVPEQMHLLGTQESVHPCLPLPTKIPAITKSIFPRNLSCSS